MSRIAVKALWLQQNVGRKGYVGAILSDGTPVALCPKETLDMTGSGVDRQAKWGMGVMVGNKTLSVFRTEKELKMQGLGTGHLKLELPKALTIYAK